MGAWWLLRPPGLPAGIAAANGRIEATEIDVDAKIPGRITDILVDEGDFVSAGQVPVHMDVKTLEAQRREAEAQLERANASIQEIGFTRFTKSVIAVLGRRNPYLTLALRSQRRAPLR